ncbi:uncharacterized protein LOC100135120 [Xenopus tropicalis]|uniref:LOC100135120 protein n=1 Tax=Xenopus tropicalis TaxID=8364 RepID=A0A803KK16_XENTR|nr:uncharacterized protein LOC100135120 [Xenopus tropicalis]AAI55973.1 LOC100135120 protein [Xenopus tropicalis]|eukprot:NP_001107318.1 uncharacterized protein LOC100135120 [Xenopus tropicalis]
MAGNAFPKVCVTFRNLAACIATEDLAALTERDINMYKDAMQEIHKTLLSMGHRILNPEILMFTEETENCQATKKQKLNACIHKLDSTIQAPDILLLVEHEKTVGVLHHQENKERGNVMSMVLSTKEEQEQGSPTHSTLESTNIQETDNPAISIFPLPVKKEEEEVYPVSACPWRRAFTEKDASPASSQMTREEEKSAPKNSAKLPSTISNRRTKNNVSFKRTLNLIHETKPSFKCTYCNERFEKPHSLKDHENIHFDEKPYKCTQCCKSYKSNAQLMVHQWNHR